MKKVFLALAIITVLTTVSCKQSEPTATTTSDSVAVQVDTVQVDTVKTDSVKK
jgi:outer membrane lipoprotein SlyB